ncbi:VOC family protein [Mariluticola halotolerans]|uniref:VOC family protein n=1 Tax=Mariluticola halotolerans TaxID=2909283 RepID=UPI0026E1AAA3|nr:VOC family protein [Mariluticola halotolerans]UJQ94477.1 VOC family protein [Mariluticola halotolerans]
MKPRKFEHIGIMVADLDKSIRFYTEVMGLTLTGRKPRDGGIELVFLRLGEWELELVGGASGFLEGDARLNHIAFTVDDIEATKTHIRSHMPDVEFSPYLELWDDLRCCFFRGPSGERLELFERPPSK